MQKRNIGFFIIILTLTLSACGQTPSGNQSSDLPLKKEVAVNPAENTQAEAENNQPLGKLNSSLRDLMTRGVAAKCSLSVAGDGASQTSTLYLDGRRMRMDGTVTSEGKQFDSHMISDGEFSYSWSEAMPSAAMKMRIPDTAKESADAEQSESMDFDQPMDLDCQAWTADGNLFEVPASVQFNDVTEMLENSVGAQSDPCRSCELVPAGPDQVQCRQNLCQD